MPVNLDELEAQESVSRDALRKQLFDLLVEFVGRAEEQIALQALGSRGHGRRGWRGLPEPGLTWSDTDPSKLNLIPLTRLALMEGGAADDHADQDAGDEFNLKNEQGNGEERGVFEQGIACGWNSISHS